MRRDSDSDQKLLASVHPEDWPNPAPAERYNLVVVGGGTAGLVTAAGAAGLGARVALVERAELGGDCLNVGCVPSKSLLRSAHALAEMRAAGRLGIEVSGDASADFPAVMERMRAIRARIAPHDSAARFRDELGVDVFFGQAQFADRQRVEVGGQSLRFRKAVIASGARAGVPPIPGQPRTGAQPGVPPKPSWSARDPEHGCRPKCQGCGHRRPRATRRARRELICASSTFMAA